MNRIKIISVLLPAVFLWSCSDDMYERLQNPTGQYARFGIAEARAWYEANAPAGKPVSFRGSGADGIDFSELRTDMNWKEADLNSDSVWSVVELPWEYEDVSEDVGLEDVMTYFEESGVDIPQVLRLVIMQNRQNGNIYGFKMAVLPDLNYALTGVDSLQSNTYLKRDDRLSGAVMFYSLEGNFVNGWKYDDGAVTAAFNPRNDSLITRDVIRCIITVAYVPAHPEWGSTVRIDCYDIIDIDFDFNIHANEDGNCCGGYNPPPGEHPSGNNSTNPPSAPKTPCEKAKEVTDSIKTMFANAGLTNAYDTITVNIGTATAEMGFAFGYDRNGNLVNMPTVTAETGASVPLPCNNEDITVVGTAHRHIDGYYDLHSIGDIYGLLDCHKANSSYITSIGTGAGGGMYALSVTDPVLANNFLANYPKASFQDGGEWKKGTGLYKTEKAFLDYFGRTNAGYANALAAVLSEFNTGLTLSKKHGDGTFKSVFISGVKKNDDGSIITATSTITDNCN